MNAQAVEAEIGARERAVGETVLFEEERESSRSAFLAQLVQTLGEQIAPASGLLIPDAVVGGDLPRNDRGAAVEKIPIFNKEGDFEIQPREDGVKRPSHGFGALIPTIACGLARHE